MCKKMQFYTACSLNLVDCGLSVGATNVFHIECSWMPLLLKILPYMYAFQGSCCWSGWKFGKVGGWWVVLELFMVLTGQDLKRRHKTTHGSALCVLLLFLLSPSISARNCSNCCRLFLPVLHTFCCKRGPEMPSFIVRSVLVLCNATHSHI